MTPEVEQFLYDLRGIENKIESTVEALEADRENLVVTARQAGATWTQIGQALGTTKQSVWEKYHHLDSPKKETV